MKVVINQSNYLPWKGYFDLIHDADLFIFHDDLQYTKNDWRNRNKIKSAHGAEWLTIPTGTNEHRLICEVTLPPDNWAQRHWLLIEKNYADAPFFELYAPFFRSVYLERKWETLSELNQFLIQAICREFLGIKTSFADSRTYSLKKRKQERVLELLGAVGATTYLSGPAARSYLEPLAFAAARIELSWKDYAGYPAYSQKHSPFDHAVSVIDVLFNTGPQAPAYIWGWRNDAR